MNTELLSLLDRLSPANQRLVRELVWKLAQLERLTIPEEHDSRLDFQSYVNPWLDTLLSQRFSPSTIAHNGFPRRPAQPPCGLHTRQVKHGT